MWATAQVVSGGNFPLIFPSRALLPATVAKLRADGVRDIVIVPYVLSDPAWLTLMRAAIKHVDKQRDACHILPASAIQRVISPDLSLELNRFFPGKHFIHFLVLKMKDFRNFVLDNSILVFDTEQVFLKLQATNLKNKEVEVNPKPKP